MIHVNRRGFLTSSALGTAGVFIKKTLPVDQGFRKIFEPAIIRRRLGKTNIELPVVSYGVMRSDNAALVKSAFQMGFVLFDTAHAYQEGRNETMLGEVFKDIPRNSFVLATKVSPDDVNRETGELGPGATKENILSKFELSLKRLQMDYVDILYLHNVSNRNTALAPQVMEAFSELKNQGKVRYTGMSTHRNEPDILQAAIDSNFYDVVLTSINFKQAHAPQIIEKIALAAEMGIGIIAMKTMAGGFLDKERKQPVNCIAALKWVLQDKNICTAIPGIVTYDQLVQNFSVVGNLDLSEPEKADLENAKLVAGLYCDGCTRCARQCKKGLPVNELMRAYMYAYGYRQVDQAYAVMEQEKIATDPCGECSGCTVYCPKEFNVSERIADISRLMGVPRDLLAFM